MDGRSAPTFLPDNLVPWIAELQPEFLVHTVEDVQIGWKIGCAGDVAITEVEHAGGFEWNVQDAYLPATGWLTT